MREHPANATTSPARADEAMRLLQEGVQDYLSKPFSSDERHARISGLITDLDAPLSPGGIAAP